MKEGCSLKEMKQRLNGLLAREGQSKNGRNARALLNLIDHFGDDYAGNSLRNKSVSEKKFVGTGLKGRGVGSPDSKAYQNLAKESGKYGFSGVKGLDDVCGKNYRTNGRNVKHTYCEVCDHICCNKV